MAGERVLVVDDDRVTSRFLASLLTEQGYEVLLAEDGEYAMELAGTSAPDVVVGELAMPYRSGHSILRALRADDALDGIAVVVLSERDREDDIVRGLEQGADDYMVKPFNARELLARIRKQLERAKQVR